MIIFLDESGDLGFDFKKEGTTHFFVVTLLVVKDEQQAKLIRKAVARSLKNKILRKRRGKPKNVELKGSSTALSVKKYFLKQLKDCCFSIYTIALKKKRVFQDLTRVPD
jgi:predicted transposase YdaD